MDFIKYEIWPRLKVKLTYGWWVVKYGGKKNIPPELIFGAIEKSMKNMNEAFMSTVRMSDPKTTNEEERKMIKDLMTKMSELDKEVKDLNKDKKL